MLGTTLGLGFNPRPGASGGGGSGAPQEEDMFNPLFEPAYLGEAPEIAAAMMLPPDPLSYVRQALAGSAIDDVLDGIYDAAVEAYGSGRVSREQDTGTTVAVRIYPPHATFAIIAAGRAGTDDASSIPWKAPDTSAATTAGVLLMGTCRGDFTSLDTPNAWNDGTNPFGAGTFDGWQRWYTLSALTPHTVDIEYSDEQFLALVMPNNSTQSAGRGFAAGYMVDFLNGERWLTAVVSGGSTSNTGAMHTGGGPLGASNVRFFCHHTGANGNPHRMVYDGTAWRAGGQSAGVEPVYVDRLAERLSGIQTILRGPIVFNMGSEERLEGLWRSFGTMRPGTGTVNPGTAIEDGEGGIYVRCLGGGLTSNWATARGSYAIEGTINNVTGAITPKVEESPPVE